MCPVDSAQVEQSRLPQPGQVIASVVSIGFAQDEQVSFIIISPYLMDFGWSGYGCCA